MFYIKLLMLPRLNSDYHEDFSIGGKFKLPFRTIPYEREKVIRPKRSVTVGDYERLSPSKGPNPSEKNYDIPFNELKHREKSKRDRIKVENSIRRL